MNTQLVGIDNLLALDRLPYLRDGVQVHYEGSIDKGGGNADWDWWLYQDSTGEWVLFDVAGPGCIYNFVQHRYPTCAVPVFRFYFDGEPTPRFTITPSEFGHKAPFLAPFAGIFEGDDVRPAGRGPIWVVRSFVPMPFAKSCRITSSVKLEGCDRAKGHGGWGHVMYHSYTTAEGVTTFTGREDYSKLLAMWSSVGADPKPTAGNQTSRGRHTIAAGATAALFTHQGQAAISALRLNVSAFTAARLGDLWLRLTWDDQARPAVEAPIGAFFGNEFGLRSLRYLMHGMTVTGNFYSFWPMPFWKAARAELFNRSTAPVTVECEIQLTPPSVRAYPREACGYFRASPYYPVTPVTAGRDTTIATLTGRGHVVGTLLGGHAVDSQCVSCEGDVRMYVDDIATPQVESDGSESFACYGWGFVAPGQNNPVSGYDGHGHPTYSFCETRLSLGDFFPFRTGLRFDFEAGNCNDCHMAHSGLLLYYGQDGPAMALTDTLVLAEDASRSAHEYTADAASKAVKLTSKYETDLTAEDIHDLGMAVRGNSTFVVKIDPANHGVRVRRRSDQMEGRQHAKVYVDDQLVTERTWYFADHNPLRRWLEDEFEIPLAYTRGKDRVRLRIEPLGPWNEFRYWIYSHSS